MNDTAPKRGRPRGSFLKKIAPPPAIEIADEALDDIATTAPADPAPSRPALRPQIKAEDPRVRAVKRAAEVRNNIGSMDDGVDEFYINQSVIPPGWSYEWKRHTVAGAEDPSYAVSLARKGWEPVEASRHPDMMPNNTKDQYITRKGMILMERPLELTEESRRIADRQARLQVRNKEAQLGEARPGEFGRNNKDHSMANIKHSWETIPVPE